VKITHTATTRRLLLGLLLGVGAGATFGQATQPAGGGNGQYLLAATEESLWVLQADARQTPVYSRGVTERFRPRDALYARVAAAAAAEPGLFAFAGDGTFYSLRGERWVPELNLPPRLHVKDFVGGGDDAYVLVSSPPAGVLPVEVDGERPATSQPFDPGGAALSVLRYDYRGWIGIAPCPARVVNGPTTRLHPRLAVLRGSPHVFWVGSDGRIRGTRLDAQRRVWLDLMAAPEVPGLVEFWVANVGRTPLLIAAQSNPAGGEDLAAFRLTAAEDGAVMEWRRVTLELSATSGDAGALRYEHAVGFNQHVALLMAGTDHAYYVRFARPDAATAEVTLPLEPLFRGQSETAAGARLLQLAALVVLFGLLVALFVFRRGAMVRVLELPRGYGPALTLQRLAAFVIDATPFLLGSAIALDLNWRAGLQDLFNWAARSDTVSGTMPPTVTLVWWALGTAAYCVYALVMELLLRRTLGKLLTGTRVLSESGEEASTRQILARNALRFLELQPPLWILGFLVVLSRNRQRVGDILAQTVIVRRVGDPQPPSEQ